MFSVSRIWARFIFHPKMNFHSFQLCSLCFGTLISLEDEKKNIKLSIKDDIICSTFRQPLWESLRFSWWSRGGKCPCKWKFKLCVRLTSPIPKVPPPSPPSQVASGGRRKWHGDGAQSGCCSLVERLIGHFCSDLCPCCACLWVTCDGWTCWCAHDPEGLALSTGAGWSTDARGQWPLSFDPCSLPFATRAVF